MLPMQDFLPGKHERGRYMRMIATSQPETIIGNTLPGDDGACPDKDHRP